jgi:hypothetical protein
VTLNPLTLSLQGFIIRITENVDAIIYIPAASGPWGEKKEKEKPQKPDILLEETKQHLETELGKSAAVIIIIPSSQG